jgi:hypothetical protein
MKSGFESYQSKHHCSEYPCTIRTQPLVSITGQIACITGFFTLPLDVLCQGLVMSVQSKLDG